MSFSSRNECLRAKARLFGDPEFVKKFFAGGIEERNTMTEIAKYLCDSGGPATGEELKINEYSVVEG